MSVFQGADVLTTSSSTLANCLIALAAIIALDGSVEAAAAAAAPPPAPAAAGRDASGAQGPAPGTSATPSPPAQNYFDVREYRVLGNTTLSNRDIEATLYPLLGDHKTLTDVETARAALEKTYHDRGFSTVFVDIPEQDVSDKIVRLKVTEGRLNEVRISGARYFSERKILAAVPAATPGTVPNVPQLQQQLSAVNVTTADRSVVPVLKAGPVPGTVDLALNVDDHLPLHGSLEFDNQNTPGTKPLRSTVSLSYADLFDELDNVSVQYQASPQEWSQVKVFAANYAWGAFQNGLRPSVYFIDSNSNVPAISTLGVLGKGQIYGSRLSFPLTDAPGMPQSFTFGADYKHFLESIALASQAGQLANTPISYVNLSLAYGGSWSSDLLQGSLTSSANFGPRGAPNNSDTFANKRFKGEANYFYVKIDGSLYIHLPKGFQLNLRADGQFAVEPLITNEDFSITGAGAVRGYLEAESLSDSGLLGSVQLQSPIWQMKTLPLGAVFVFFDAGHSHVIDALPGETVALNLHSWGAGLNLLPGRPVTGILTWADPLSDGPNTHRGDSRLLFMLRGAF
ncbi:MAG: ShlB/FhaC/HecB family hemolysin secretion/activation protein [Steroidobacteraceae bacterium]